MLKASTSAQSSLLLIGTALSVAAAIYLWWSSSLREVDDVDKENESGKAARRHDFTEEMDSTEEERFPTHLKREIHKEQRRQAKIPLLAMKKPMYDNIHMLDPQGVLLCTISTKKAKWYVKRGLAVWKDETETNMQLLFEPSHRSNQSPENSKDQEEEAFFNKSIKDNVCVVCGHGEYFMRHYIVPYACRSLLPEKFKMHMAHDVVILCPDCHLECKKIATNRVKFLEGQSRKDPNSATPYFVDRKLYKVKSSSLALLRWREKLPPTTIEEYETLVKDHFQIAQKELTAKVLQQGAEIDSDIPNPEYIPAAEVIVESLCKDENAIESFVRGWRKHFLETMQPQHLPSGWSVDSPVECTSAERKRPNNEH